MLLIRRAEHPADPWSGHWSFPGGRRDPADTSVLDTALRELYEECGITLPPDALEAELLPMPARRRTGPLLLVAPFLFRVPAELPTVLDPVEAVEALWIPLALLRDPAHHCLGPVPGLPAGMLFPAVDLTPVPLWGFTYRVIADWLGLVSRTAGAAQAVRQVADGTLDFLLSLGLVLHQPWSQHTAEVQGLIPVQPVLDYFSHTAHIPVVSAVEVRPDLVRIVGLAFEEYCIRALSG